MCLLLCISEQSLDVAENNHRRVRIDGRPGITHRMVASARHGGLQRSLRWVPPALSRIKGSCRIQVLIGTSCRAVSRLTEERRNLKKVMEAAMPRDLVRSLDGLGRICRDHNVQCVVFTLIWNTLAGSYPSN